MIPFYSNIDCSQSKVIFKWRKNNNKKKNKKALQAANVCTCTSCFSFSLSQNSHRNAVKARSQQTEKPTLSLRQGMRRSLRRTFFPPWRRTLTSRSLQSIARPFQKRFREVFENARILIFYLSIRAWEEISLPKGWSFLVFDEGKATKENMSFFWFIWPLNLQVYILAIDLGIVKFLKKNYRAVFWKMWNLEAWTKWRAKTVTKAAESKLIKFFLLTIA